MSLKKKSVIFLVIFLPILYSSIIEKECWYARILFKIRCPFFQSVEFCYCIFPNPLNNSDCINDIYTNCLLLSINLVIPFKNKKYQNETTFTCCKVRLNLQYPHVMKVATDQVSSCLKCPIIIECQSAIAVQVPKLLEVLNFSIFVISLSALIKICIDNQTLYNI